MQTRAEAPGAEPRDARSGGRRGRRRRQGVRRRAGADGVSLRVGAGRDRRGRRPERLREVDAARARLRAAGARRRHASRPAPAALMPQRDALLPWLSALDNAGLALRVAGASRARRARRRAHEHFAAFGLEGFERARPARALGRDAPARRVPAHAARRAARAVPRRAVRRARRADARCRCSTGSPTRCSASRGRCCSSRTTSRRPCCSPTASCCSRRGPGRVVGDARGRRCRARARATTRGVVALRERALRYGAGARAVSRAWRCARARRCSAPGRRSCASAASTR